MPSTINKGQRQQVLSETLSYIARARDLYNREFSAIPVEFDLRGKAAGMYRVSAGQQLIRYNPWIFARYFDENMENTVPHEVAHYLTDELYGRTVPSAGTARRVRPHGVEWQAIMRQFGVEPSRTFAFDTAGLPVRSYRYFSYICDCGQHKLGSRRHMKVRRQQAAYLCRKCGGQLREQTEAG